AEATADLFRAQNDIGRGDWSEGRLVLAGLFAKVRNEPDLADLRGEARQLLERAERALADRELEAAARRDLARFRSLLKEALFREARFGGLGLPDEKDASIRPARAALAIFKPETTLWPKCFSERERAEVADGCYTLHMILAGVERDPRAGLAALEQARSLRPPTRAFRLRRAACLEALGERREADLERVAAAKLEPRTPVDHFLTGLDHFQALRWNEARRHFDASLSLLPENFWSEFLLALCYLQLDRPIEAKVCL